MDDGGVFDNFERGKRRGAETPGAGGRESVHEQVDSFIQSIEQRCSNDMDDLNREYQHLSEQRLNLNTDDDEQPLRGSRKSPYLLCEAPC